MKWFQEQALQGTSCVSKDVIATTQMFLMWAGKRFSQLANSHSVNILVWYSVILENNLIQVESSWVDSRWVGTSGKEVHLSSKELVVLPLAMRTAVQTICHDLQVY